MPGREIGKFTVKMSLMASKINLISLVIYIIKNDIPLLALCLIVSISTPVILAFFIADVARGQPDRLQMYKKQNK